MRVYPGFSCAMPSTAACVARRAGSVLLLAVLVTGLGPRAAGATEAGAARDPVKEAGAAGDLIRLPAASSVHVSPSGRYRFEIATPDGWKSKHAEARLYRTDGGRRELVWQGMLPQEYGPRFVLVAPDGEVLMFDEWINVKSRFAVVILYPRDGHLVTHDFDDVQAALGVPPAQLVRTANHGWWIAAPPALGEHGDVAVVPAAGKRLAVSLKTGALSAR